MANGNKSIHHYNQTTLLPIMNYNWVPQENNFIRVQFELNGSKIWWPAQITEISCQGSRRRHTLKVVGTLLYNEISSITVNYKEETGAVRFINDSFLNILDADGNNTTDASWHYDFNVPTETSTKYAHINNIVAKESTTDPNGSTMQTLEAEQVGSTIPNIVELGAHQGTEKNVVDNTITSGSLAIELGKLQGRVDTLEKQLSSSCVSRMAKVDEHYTTTMKYSLRRKLLEHMQRPLQAYRPRLKTPYSGCFQAHTIKITIDCDYKQFTNLLRDTRDNFGQADELLYHPTFLQHHSPTYSIGPLQIIFRTFDTMAKWLLISDRQDIDKLLCRVSRTRHLSAAIVLGSTIFDAQESGQGIEFFSGNSSNSGLHSTLPDSTENTSATSFRLETTEWDDVNDCFMHSFKKIRRNPDITVDNETCSLINNYFQVIWTGLPLSTRSQWSADSTYTGSTILGTITVVLPSIEIQGINMLDQLDIRTSQDPQL